MSDNGDSGTWGGDGSDDDIPDVPDIETAEQADEMLPNADGTDTDSSEDGQSRIEQIRAGFEQYDIDRPETDYSRLGSAAARVVTTLPKPLLGVRGTLFKRMAVKGIEKYYKVSGGDAIAINAKAGQQIALEPVLYRAPEECDEGEKPGWKVKGRDKVWNPAKEGNSVNYLGRTPTVQLEDDDHVEAGWLAPRIGQAIEMDQYWPIFTDATFNAVIDAQPGANGQQPVADGGMDIDLELDTPGKWAGDNIVDLGSGDGYDGMRISTAKAREWQAEHTDSEHMQMQEDRGYLRGLANGDEGPGIIKLMMICAAIILGTMAIVFLGPELVGGGGGSSINPLFALPTGL